MDETPIFGKNTFSTTDIDGVELNVTRGFASSCFVFDTADGTTEGPLAAVQGDELAKLRAFLGVEQVAEQLGFSVTDVATILTACRHERNAAEHRKRAARAGMGVASSVTMELASLDRVIAKAEGYLADNSREEHR